MEKLILDEPDEETINYICTEISDGRSLAEIASKFGVRRADIWGWLDRNKGYRQRYKDAVMSKEEMMRDRLIDELKYIAFSDIRKLFDESGAVTLPHTWPGEAAAAVRCVKFRADGSVEVIKNDKLKSIQMIGQELRMFSNTLTHDGKVTLEDLITQTAETTESEDKDG